MNPKLLKWQSALSALLLTTLSAEWWHDQSAQQQLDSALTLSAAPGYQPGELPEISANDKSVDDYNDMIERPLFIEGRKPVPEPEPENTATATANAGEIEDWQLMGVFSKNRRLNALFSKRNEAKKHQKARQGEMLLDWQLKTIASDKVILERNGEIKELQLHKPKPKTPGATATTPTPKPPPINRNTPPTPHPVPPAQPTPAPQPPVPAIEPEEVREEFQ